VNAFDSGVRTYRRGQRETVIEAADTRVTQARGVQQSHETRPPASYSMQAAADDASAVDVRTCPRRRPAAQVAADLAGALEPRLHTATAAITRPKTMCVHWATTLCVKPATHGDTTSHKPSTTLAHFFPFRELYDCGEGQNGNHGPRRPSDPGDSRLAVKSRTHGETNRITASARLSQSGTCSTLTFLTNDNVRHFLPLRILSD